MRQFLVRPHLVAVASDVDDGCATWGHFKLRCYPVAAGAAEQMARKPASELEQQKTPGRYLDVAVEPIFLAGKWVCRLVGTRDRFLEAVQRQLVRTGVLVDRDHDALIGVVPEVDIHAVAGRVMCQTAVGNCRGTPAPAEQFPQEPLRGRGLVGKPLASKTIDGVTSKADNIW